MDKKEKFIIPLTIGAAVISIWAALRNGNSGATVRQGGNVNLPGVPPLQQTLFGLPSDYRFVSPDAGNGNGPQYAIDAANNPYGSATGANININAGFNPATYLHFNVDPWSDLRKAYDRADTADTAKADTSGGCGCGGGCKEKELVAKCGQFRNPRLMDGHGDCLTTRPSFPMLGEQNDALRFIAASYDVGFLAAGSDYGIANAGPAYAAGGY